MLVDYMYQLRGMACFPPTHMYITHYSTLVGLCVTMAQIIWCVLQIVKTAKRTRKACGLGMCGIAWVYEYYEAPASCKCLHCLKALRHRLSMQMHLDNELNLHYTIFMFTPLYVCILLGYTRHCRYIETVWIWFGEERAGPGEGQRTAHYILCHQRAKNRELVPLEHVVMRFSV